MTMLCIAHLIHRPIKITVLETFMLCKATTGFSHCDYKNCFDDKLRGKGGITCGLVNKSLVWFDSRVVYALHSIDFVYCSPFPGGFTYFLKLPSEETYFDAWLSSPRISSGAKWRCLQFWYYFKGVGQMRVLLKTTSYTLKTYNYRRYPSRWRLERVPLSANFTYQVSIIKNSLSCLLL